MFVVLTMGCAGTLERHPRATIIGGSAAFGGLAVGLPIAHECTEPPDDCGASRTAMYVAGFAAAGALAGLWIAHQWWLQDAGRRAVEASAPAKPKKK